MVTGRDDEMWWWFSFADPRATRDKQFLGVCVRCLIGAAISIALIACGYEASFEDCAVRCDGSECPEGLACGNEGLCRSPGASQTCAAVLGTRPSCENLPTTCGPASNEDCCSTATPIPGGTFYRGYDVAADGMYPDMSYPATVSPFMLDRFEVTVGRFRKFVEAGMGTQTNPPAGGAGAHAKIPGSGWDASWNGELVADTSALSAALQCDSLYQTWTTAPGMNESLPLNCMIWFEAAAFCAWDGGYLPTEAEWNYAAAGGDEQRAYPWSSPASSLNVDCSRANYLNGSTFCTPGVGGAVALPNRVGNQSPLGDGRWGQTDLGGNAWEWVLDSDAAVYNNPCDDCANLTQSERRVIRGGDFSHEDIFMRSGHRGLPTTENTLPESRTRDVGFRCARP